MSEKEKEKQEEKKDPGAMSAHLTGVASQNKK